MDGQPIIINPPASNGVGTAGFILAIFAIFLAWIPVFGWFLWLIAFLMSFFGMFKKPRGLAVAGFLISISSLLIYLILYAGLFGIVSVN